MKLSTTLTLFILISFFAAPLHANPLFNCKKGASASLGDLKHQVRLSCGEPDQAEVIGYIDQVRDKERIRVMKVEEWIYTMPFYGETYFYSLVFEGNRLVEIKKAGKK